MIIYATNNDANIIRTWINAEPDVAWIIKVSENGRTCHWKAVQAIEVLQEQTYALWHIKSGPLNIPSGEPNIPDKFIIDPFNGWSQTMEDAGETSPWFGDNLPGPYTFSFSETGRRAPENLARSDFSWAEDRYKSIGKPGHPAAKLWWKKLQRFLERSSVQIPWTSSTSRKRIVMAYIFPEAKFQIDQGRDRELNP